MNLKPKYCSQCAAAVEQRIVEDRKRPVCPACHIVFYLNPVPVAACVVVNEKKELLLVKRALEPQKGKWCLPIGFAELDETIQQAALRELAEETGVKGQIVRLLDAYSSKSEMYGDLLTVTFEVKPQSGEPRPGDDAQEVAWFPLDDRPELAFASNEAAVRIYKKFQRVVGQ